MSMVQHEPVLVGREGLLLLDMMSFFYLFLLLPLFVFNRNLETLRSLLCNPQEYTQSILEGKVVVDQVEVNDSLEELRTA